jgi:DNA polymerase-3 subunit delta'
MADESEDPREVAWHPRLRRVLIGHQAAEDHFLRAFRSGKLHHAWLITGARGTGKATLAYRIAGFVLHQGQGAEGLSIPAESRTAHWIATGAHPDLFVLERKLGDTKPRKLKGAIAVDDARALTDFFAHTAAGGGWRVAIVDAADDLNGESANALLKLVEEPPPRCLILLVCHSPGRLIRTMRSRCMRLPLEALTVEQVEEVVAGLPLSPAPSSSDLSRAASLSAGSPGRALDLIGSEGAGAFNAYRGLRNLAPPSLIELGNRFSGKPTAGDDFNIFCDLLLDWLAGEAKGRAASSCGGRLAAAHEQISHSIRRTNGLNLDRRQAVIDAVLLIDDALKAA